MRRMSESKALFGGLNYQTNLLTRKQVYCNIVSKETSGGKNMNHELLTLFASYMEKQEVLSKLTESEKLQNR